jgi:hypothetical protein
MPCSKKLDTKIDLYRISSILYGKKMQLNKQKEIPNNFKKLCLNYILYFWIKELIFIINLPTCTITFLSFKFLLLVYHHSLLLYPNTCTTCFFATTPSKPFKPTLPRKILEFSRTLKCPLQRFSWHTVQKHQQFSQEVFY